MGQGTACLMNTPGALLDALPGHPFEHHGEHVATSTFGSFLIRLMQALRSDTSAALLTIVEQRPVDLSAAVERIGVHHAQILRGVVRHSQGADVIDWNDRGMRGQRGFVLGALEGLHSEVGVPARQTGEAGPTRKQEERRERDSMVLKALPPSHSPPLKSQDVLMSKLARKGLQVSLRTIGRSLEDLRRAGLVDPVKLRRSPKGDSAPGVRES